jgi:hypothetical protein
LIIERVTNYWALIQLPIMGLCLIPSFPDFMTRTASLFFLLATAACNSPEAVKSANSLNTPTNPLHQAVLTYIQANTASFPGYEAVRWGPPIIYTRASEAAIKGVVAMKNFDDALVPRNQALADYKASLAQHDPPAKTNAIKARYGKANKYNDSLLAIANSFIGVKDTTRLGTQILHTYHIKNEAGVIVLDSTTFVIYPKGQVEVL